MSTVTPELQLDVERFLYEEAALLDRREYRQWLNLFAPDLQYRMPARTDYHELASGAEPPASFVAAYFDETLESLGQRIKRLETGKAWAEMPPSRTRHSISNVYLRPAAVEGEWDVECCFMLYRSRAERHVDIFVGGRVDRLRPASDGTRWKIARRVIVLDQSTLLANNLSIFF